MSYWMPKTVEELAFYIRNKDEQTYFCAGATDLMLHIRNKDKASYSIIDLTQIEELKQIKENETHISIGAGVTMHALEESKVVTGYHKALVKAASMVGSTQIRNLATIGGNIANASQSADTVPVLLAYHAVLHLMNAGGTVYEMPLSEAVREDGEKMFSSSDVITAISLPKESSLAAFEKVGSRKAVTISKINGCLKMTIEQGQIKEAVLFLGAVGKWARKAEVVEMYLTGRQIEEISMSELRKAVYAQIEAYIPNRTSKEYKKPAAFGCILQMLSDCGVKVVCA